MYLALVDSIDYLNMQKMHAVYTHTHVLFHPFSIMYDSLIRKTLFPY
jgi:hypothetical protein